MKYKVYIVKNGHEVGEAETFIEADFNFGCGFDDMEEALLSIKSNGYYCKQYTILPYIYMT